MMKKAGRRAGRLTIHRTSRRMLGACPIQEELAYYDGIDGRPAYLGVLGKVYDVSTGSFYKPGGGYEFFSGRDASRAFVTGKFEGEGLTDDVVGLTPSQMVSLEEWVTFYPDHETYTYVGKLSGTYYDDDGNELDALRDARAQIDKGHGEKKKVKNAELEFPHCNSRWTRSEGGKVWCTDSLMKHREPKAKLVPRKSSKYNRCACIELDLEHDGSIEMQVYPDCPRTSATCVTSPPEV